MNTFSVHFLGGQCSHYGSIRLPVKPSQTAYAQLKYVRGVPTFEVHKALPLDRVRIINSLIAGMNSLGNAGEKKEGDFQEKNLELLAKDFHLALKANPSFSGVDYSAGAFFSLYA